MKKISYLLIIALLVTGLSACGSKKNNSTADKTTQTASKTSEVKAEKKTVDFNSVSTEIMKTVQQKNKNLNLLWGAAKDINGDNADEVIIVVGSKENDYLKDISVMVFNGQTKNKISEYPMNYDGYSPKILLQDFDGDKLADILITIESGGTAGFTFNDILTLKSGKLTSLLEGKFKDQAELEFVDNGSVGFTFKGILKEYFVSLNAEQKKIFNSIKSEAEANSGDCAYFRNYEMSGIDIDNDGVYELKTQMWPVFSANNNSDSIAQIEEYYKYVNSQWKLIKVKVTPKNGTTQVKETSLSSSSSNASKISKDEALKIVRNIVNDKNAVLTVVNTDYKRNNRNYYVISFVVDDMEADFRYCVDKSNGSVYIASVDNSFKPYKK